MKYANYGAPPCNNGFPSWSFLLEIENWVLSVAGDIQRCLLEI